MEKIITKYTQKEFLIRMFWGLIIGSVVTAMLGYPGVITIPITAILICWANRGLRGSVEYIGFRLRIQFIFIIVNTALWDISILLIPNVQPWTRCAVFCSIMIAVWLQVYYRFKLLPLNLTAVFSTIIYTMGLMSTHTYGAKRLLWNIFGLAIGVIAAYIWPRAEKLQVTKDQLSNITSKAFDELNSLKSLNGPTAKYAGFAATITAEMTAIAAYLAVVLKDHTKTKAFPMRLLPQKMFTFKYKKYNVPMILKMNVATAKLIELTKCLKEFNAYLTQMEESRLTLFVQYITSIQSIHSSSLNGEKVNLNEVAWGEIIPATTNEIIIMDAMLNYKSAVIEFAKLV